MIGVDRMDGVGLTLASRVKGMARPSKTVIPSTTTGGRSLYAVIAIMCFLASLALGLTLSVRQTAGTYASDLSRAITVQIKPNDAADPTLQMSLVLDILRGTPGLYDIKALSTEEAAALVEPHIGRGNLPKDLQMPQIVTVRLDNKQTSEAAIKRLGEKLSSDVPGASLNDHSQWKSRLLGFSTSLQALCMAALGLIVIAAIAIVAFATRAAMATNRQIVEVLHLIGAKDGFIAAEFQGHFVRLGLWAGLCGAVCAALTLWGVGRFVNAGTEYFIPGLTLGLDAYGSLLLVPLLSALVSMVTARLTALSVVGRVM
ncbi:MAG: cell division protein FtsX [Alphaproteobacteria bacterium]